jgi:hypothetical protein
MPKGSKLDLYPGDKLLVFTRVGQPPLTAVAWGGPPEEHPKGPNEPFGEGPTDPGEYVIWGVEPHHTTKKWPMSRIPWGAPLKVNPRDMDDILWEDRPGHWKSLMTMFPDLKNRRPPPHAFVAALNQRYFGIRAVPSTWVFNDFGPRAVRYFVDLNKDGRLDGKEQKMGEMFHTTPNNEGEEEIYRREHPGSTSDPPANMFESHGCVHMVPTQFKRLIEMGAFARGMKLTIHTYSEHYLTK